MYRRTLPAMLLLAISVTVAGPGLADEQQVEHCATVEGASATLDAEASYVPRASVTVGDEQTSVGGMWVDHPEEIQALVEAWNENVGEEGNEAAGDALPGTTACVTYTA